MAHSLKPNGQALGVWAPFCVTTYSAHLFSIPTSLFMCTQIYVFLALSASNASTFQSSAQVSLPPQSPLCLSSIFDSSPHSWVTSMMNQCFHLKKGILRVSDLVWQAETIVKGAAQKEQSSICYDLVLACPLFKYVNWVEGCWVRVSPASCKGSVLDLRNDGFAA